MQYPDLIWTLLATVGGYLLLIGHEKDLTSTNWWGVWLIFIGVIFQIYWDLVTNPTGGNIFGINSNIVGVTIILIVEMPLLVWPGWLRKWVIKRRLLREKR